MLLIEIHAEDEHDLGRQAAEGLQQIINVLAPIEQANFSRDATVCDQLWRIPKRALPCSGSGYVKVETTVIIEDVGISD